MEILYQERFNYATIIPTRNYCKLSEKKYSLNTFNSDLDDIDDIFVSKMKFSGVKYDKQLDSTFFLLPSKTKKKTKYFYNDNHGIDEKIEISYASKNPKSLKDFFTTKDRHIKSHYADPFTSISVHLIERSIKKYGDKITIKVYRQNKKRDFNCIYFIKNTSIDSITIDLRTGNFTILEIQNGRHIKSKKFVKNSFLVLLGFLNKNEGLFNFREKKIFKDTSIHEEYQSTFNDLMFGFWIKDIFNFDCNINNPKIFLEKFLKFFIEQKKIKIPNNYREWMVSYYPTEKYLKKNDRKLLLSILDMFQIKSKITNKIVHTYDDIDIRILCKLCYLFGDDYPKHIGNIDPKRFNLFKIRKINDESINFKNNFINFKNHTNNVTDSEKENIIKIINSDYDFNVFNLMNEMYDHFNMIKMIREFDPQTKLKAKTWSEFNSEHMEYSKIIGAIRKGWVIEYQFNDDMIKDMEKPVTIEINIGDDIQPVIVNETFYPVVLKREEEFIEEGNFMHHCVASYASKEKSVIISVRNESSSDRVTCEFDAQSGLLIQSKHFCNRQPPGDFVLAIDEIKNKVHYYSRRGMFGSIDKKRVPVKINGVEITPEKPQPILREDLFLPF